MQLCMACRSVKWIMIALSILTIDQFTKKYIDYYFYYGERKKAFYLLDFVLLHNNGIAFSLLSTRKNYAQCILVFTSLVMSLFTMWLIHKQPLRKSSPHLALALVLGGILGNMLDRIMHGYVIDFLLFCWKGCCYPVFNIADLAITAGTVLSITSKITCSYRPQHNI